MGYPHKILSEHCKRVLLYNTKSGEIFKKILATDIAFLCGCLRILINQDIGCGIGGPARAIARYSGASVMGLNICHYQVNRAKELTKLCGLQDLVSFKQV